MRRYQGSEDDNEQEGIENAREHMWREAGGELAARPARYVSDGRGAAVRVYVCPLCRDMQQVVLPRMREAETDNDLVRPLTASDRGVAYWCPACAPKLAAYWRGATKAEIRRGAGKLSQAHYKRLQRWAKLVRSKDGNCG